MISNRIDHLHARHRLAVALDGFTLHDWDDDIEVSRARKRKPSLASAIRQAVKAGMTVSGATIAPDGSVVLTFGGGSTATSDNPWDRVLRNASH